MTADEMTRFEVVRADLHTTRAVTEPRPALDEGQALLRVDAFGLTANNISYAVFGDMLGYWGFFPSAGEWGQVPAWGFAEVIDSAVDDLPAGTRLFGYVPMASHLVMRPRRDDPSAVVDASEHRAGLPPAYNRYRLVDADPMYDPAREDEQMLLWPLFFTGFVLDAFLARNDRFGASTVVLSSASSKTAISTAHLLAQRPGVTVIGLTSTANVEMVRALGPYDQVVAYDDVDGLDPADAVYLDFAGDAGVRAAVHRRFGDRLAHSAMIGGTHWDRGAGEEAPGVEPTFFFAPDHWGPDTEAALPDAWRGFVDGVDRWLTVEHRTGADAVRAAFLDTLDGRADPAVGLVLSL